MTVFSQVAAAVPQTAVWDLFVKAFEVVATLLATYIANGFRTLRKDVKDVKDDVAEMRLQHARWDVTLVGINGDNGINGTVKQLRADVERLKERSPAFRQSHGRRAENGA